MANHNHPDHITFAQNLVTGPKEDHEHDHENDPMPPIGERKSIAKANEDYKSKQSKQKSKEDRRKKAKNAIIRREQELASRNATYVQQYLLRKTHFDKDQIRALMQMYKKFKGAYPMDRLRFRDMVASLFGITDNVMLDRIFQAFDGDNEGSVSETEWIIGLSIQLKGNLDEQIAYAYDVYDINGDRALGRDEVQNCLRGCLNVIPGVLEQEDMDEAMNDIAELAMKRFDVNRDGNIKFSEFRHVCRQDPLLLEAFGECLPNDRAALPFVSLLETNPRNYNCFLSRPGDSSWKTEKLRYEKKQMVHEQRLQRHSLHEEIETLSGDSDSPLLWSMSTLDTGDKDTGRKGVTAIRTKDARKSMLAHAHAGKKGVEVKKSMLHHTGKKGKGKLKKSR